MCALPDALFRCEQKHPESQIAGALKAVVLSRTGKAEEAAAAADAVAATVPTDEHVLHTLGLVWKAAGQHAVRPRRRACVVPSR